MSYKVGSSYSFKWADDAGRSVSGMKLRRSLPQVVYVCDGTDFCRAAPRALREIGALALTTCLYVVPRHPM